MSPFGRRQSPIPERQLQLAGQQSRRFPQLADFSEADPVTPSWASFHCEEAACGLLDRPVATARATLEW